jgi:hypothetical protein
MGCKNSKKKKVQKEAPRTKNLRAGVPENRHFDYRGKGFKERQEGCRPSFRAKKKVTGFFNRVRHIFSTSLRDGGPVVYQTDLTTSLLCHAPTSGKKSSSPLGTPYLQVRGQMGNTPSYCLSTVLRSAHRVRHATLYRFGLGGKFGFHSVALSSEPATQPFEKSQIPE